MMLKKESRQFLLREEIIEDNRRLMRPKEIYLCQGLIYTFYYLDVGVNSIFDPTHKLYSILSGGPEAIDRYLKAERVSI